MATTNLLPRNVSGGESLTYDAWAKSTGSTAYSLLDDPVGSPDDTDYVSINNTSSLQSVYITNWSLGSATITAVKVKVRAKGQFTSGKLRARPILSGGSEDTGSTSDDLTLTTSFADYTSDITSRRPGGGSWTTSDLSSFQIAWIKPSGGSNTITVSQIYIEVTYTATSNITGSQSAYIKAYDTLIGSQNAFIKAYDTLVASQSAFVKGYGNIVGSQNAYINGLGTVIASQAAYVAAYVTLSGSQAAFAAGFLTITGLQSGYVNAFDTIRGNQAAYIYGLGTAFVIGSQSAFVRAWDTQTGMRFAYVVAYTGTLTGNQNAYIVGGGFTGLIIGNQSAFVRAWDSLRGSKEGFARAYDTIRGNQAGYGVGFSTIVGNQNGFTKAFDTSRGSQPGYVQGPYIGRGSQPAYVRGAGASRIKFKLSLIEGPPNGSWTKIFMEIAETGSDVVRAGIGDNEILATLEQFSEQHTRSENVVMSVFACPVPSTGLLPSTGLKPC